MLWRRPLGCSGCGCMHACACTVGSNPSMANYFVAFLFFYLSYWGLGNAMEKSVRVLKMCMHACMCMHGGSNPSMANFLFPFLIFFLSLSGLGNAYGEVCLFWSSNWNGLLNQVTFQID